MNLSTQSLNKPEWDYTHQAPEYYKRPNYAMDAIEAMARYVGANTKEYAMADIGAGTANLTRLMHDKVARIWCVEPNYGMRKIGMDATKDFANVNWMVGTGEETTLERESVNLAAFGSSFNTTDRQAALVEAHRILKDDGYFVCMWNNRDLTIPTQKRTEDIIKTYFPDYSHGTRREQQADVILESRLFNDIHFLERPQNVSIHTEDFCEAWRSVTNKFWDLNTAEGQEVIGKIVTDLKNEFKDSKTLDIKYVTRIWIARKQ